MDEKVIYMLSAVAVGWAVTFALRALPFALFAGRGRNPPQGVERFGKVVSPVVIAGLVVYSYSTLDAGGGPAWLTPWPYLAGALTVALQLAFRNSLASIVAGTILYMSLLSFSGCSSLPDSIELDSRHPVLSISGSSVKFADRLVPFNKVPRLLKSYDVPYDRPIHILAEGDLHDLRPARQLMAVLCKAGYTRPVLVRERHAESRAIGPRNDDSQLPRQFSRHGTSAAPSGKVRR